LKPVWIRVLVASGSRLGAARSISGRASGLFSTLLRVAPADARPIPKFNGRPTPMELNVYEKPGSLMKQLALNGSAAVGVLHGVTGRSGSLVALG